MTLENNPHKIPDIRTSFRWTLKMAWRDSRRNRNRLILFVTAISLGIAALVGITSFRENLIDELDDQAKSLLGSDFVVSSNIPLNDSLYAYFLPFIGETSHEINFSSMVYFPRTDGTRLVQVRSLEGNYPYYGKIETEPENAAARFQMEKAALVDDKVMLQYNVAIGDSVKIGKKSYVIIGSLKKVPGQTEIGTSVAPIVFLPLKDIWETGLLQKGSRINYVNYFQFDPAKDTTGLWADATKAVKNAGLNLTTIEMRKNETGRSFKDLSAFLEIIAFTALLLGCLGVAGAIHVYLKSKIQTVAILRCLGMKARQAIDIYLVQIALFGGFGALIGCLLGMAIHLYLPVLAQSFIPIEFTPNIYWPVVAAGLALGTGISVLFGLISLVSLRSISPLQAIRLGQNGKKKRIDYLQILVAIMIVAFIFSAQYWLIGKLKDALANTGILLASVGLLYAMATGVTWAVRKFMPPGLPYVWRQGLSNLYRPNNQTATLILTLGLGTAFLGMLYFMQDLLVKQVTIAGAGERPNTVLFDIQSSQKEEIRNMTLDYDLPVMQEVPIVTMRLLSINGKNKEDFRSDSLSKMPEWAFNREYRVTYRDKLIDSEKLDGGTWTSEVKKPGDTIFVSIAKGYAENLDLQLGDELIFNVQGALMKTYIGSFRDIDWRRVQTNFLVLFPAGVLEKAPQFHVLITRIGNNDLSARYQRAIVRFFPNVSVIDLDLVLKTVEELLGKVAFIIQFMAFFSIATGFIVLIGAMLLSKYQRIQENVLLRTLGASSRQLWKIIAVEYFMLGALGTLAGLILATLFTVLLGHFVFELSFFPAPFKMLVIFTSITGFSLIIGLLNSRQVVAHSPLEILREEV